MKALQKLRQLVRGTLHRIVRLLDSIKYWLFVRLVVAPACLVMAWKDSNRKLKPSVPKSCPCGPAGRFENAVLDKRWLDAQRKKPNPTGQVQP
jgi:hypothetical protein